MSTAALRQRAYKQRLTNGRGILRIEVDLGEVADMLVGQGFLQQWNSENRDAIERGVERTIEALCRLSGDVSPE